MSRGLGRVQRGMLLALARIEVEAAEEATRQQQRYQPPTRAGIGRVLHVAMQHELREPLIAKMRAEHKFQLGIDRLLEAAADAGDQDAFTLKALRGKRRDFDPDPGHARPDCRDQRDWLDDTLSPSRALGSLRQRGLIAVVDEDACFVLGMKIRIRRGVVLRGAGLIAARKHGLPDSEIVDLDHLAEQLT